MDEAQASQLTERQQYWHKHIKACESAGKTIAEYTKEQGIEAKSMYAGKKSLVKKGVLPRTRSPRFKRAHVDIAVVGNECRIQLPNGVSVVFCGPMDAKTLSTVLSTAAAIE
jgi:hypothetical protein